MTDTSFANREPVVRAPDPKDPDHPQWKRRRRRNSTLMALGIAMCGGATAAGVAGISNAVLTNALYAGVLLASMGAGLYTWTALDRLRPQ